MIDFSRNYFELFGLPSRFRIDDAALEHAYRTLQRSVHPDAHAAGSDADRRAALQASARVNEAHRTLRDPVTRAEYLLELRGVDATAQTDTRLPLEFLTAQLERREAADVAAGGGDAAALASIADELRADTVRLTTEVEQVLDGDDVGAARDRVRELRFLSKLADDLDAMRDAVLER